MEILQTAPVFIAIILVIYGAFLSGFTGGAVAGGGILFYVISLTMRGVPSNFGKELQEHLVLHGVYGLQDFYTICFPTITGY